MEFPWCPVAAALAVAALAGCGPSRESILAALSSPEGSVRAQAINQLGLRGDEDDLPHLLAHLTDPDVLVRSSVAAALAHFDSKKSADALGELAADGVESVQVIAVRSLAKEKNARARQYLLLAYQRDGSAVRAAVAAGLEAAGASPALAVEAEAKALWDRFSTALVRGGAAERVAAAEELGRSGRPEAVDRLVPYLGADAHILAEAAARGLGASGLPAAREPLEAMLAEDDPDLATAGVSGLLALGMPAAAPALARAAVKGGQVGLAALDALAALPGQGAALCDATLSDDGDVAARAADLAAERGQACDVRPLVAKLGRAATAQQAALAALAALGQKPDAAEAARILALLRSGSPEVQPLAARAAGALGLADALPDLAKAQAAARGRLAFAQEHWVKQPLPARFAPGFAPKTDLDDKYREKVGLLMAKLQQQGVRVDDPGSGPVGPLFTDGAELDLALAAEAGLAIVRLNGPGAAAVAAALARDPSAEVRGIACEAAVALPPVEGWPLIKSLAEDSDSDVHLRMLGMVPRWAKGLPDGPAAGAAAPVNRRTVAAYLAGLLGNADDRDGPIIDDLGALGPSAATPAAVTDLREGLAQPGLAGESARALAALGTPDCRKALLDRLRLSPSAGLPEIVDAVASLKDADALPLVRPLLYHVRPGVRAAAARAVLALHDGAARPDLQALGSDYDAAVRKAAGATATVK